MDRADRRSTDDIEVGLQARALGELVEQIPERAGFVGAAGSSTREDDRAARGIAPARGRGAQPTRST